MEGERVRQWEAQCVEEQAPACTAACPVHVDARKLAQNIGAGNFSAALKVFTATISLPRILSRICDHPCHAACRRNEAGDALNIAGLERAAIEFGGNIPAPRKCGTSQQKIAIVGGGLSGVVAAIDLLVRGYGVHIFEAEAQLLSRLRSLGDDQLPKAAIDADLAVLATLGAVLHCNEPVSSDGFENSLDSLLTGFDAVYLAPGHASDWCISMRPGFSIDPVTYATGIAKLFAGGTFRTGAGKYSPITSFQDGRFAALSIDRMLQGASLTASRDLQGSQKSRLHTNTAAFAPSTQIVAAASNAHYTRDEAQQEAARCFPCSCKECVKVCEYLKEYGSYPKRYVREIYNNLTIVMGVRNLNRMINSCSLCGLCEAVCPEKMSMADVCLDARQSMVATKKMPVSAHEFALRDMAFSTGEAFAVARHQPGFSKSEALFFPGCQLAASSPEHVQSCYEFLCESHDGGVGLVLNCCGAPARWAGREDLFDQNTKVIENIWRTMGQPKIITACSSCFRTLKESLPEISVESLWPHLNNDAALSTRPQLPGREFAIHDPCATRGVSEVQDSVRDILHRMGVKSTELNERGQTTCCGYGGLARFANPDLVDKTVKRRAQQSDADYVTYCAMCRDSFARQGKRALHVLDLVFAGGDKDPAARSDPGFSVRQDNRARLKTQLLGKLWGEGVDHEGSMLPLKVSEEVRQTMERRMILDTDVSATVQHAESTGEKLRMHDSGHWLANHRSGCVTYWVEYTHEADGFHIYNAYSHRMQVR